MLLLRQGPMLWDLIWSSSDWRLCLRGFCNQRSLRWVLKLNDKDHIHDDDFEFGGEENDTIKVAAEVVKFLCVLSFNWAEQSKGWHDIWKRWERRFTARTVLSSTRKWLPLKWGKDRWVLIMMVILIMIMNIVDVDHAHEGAWRGDLCVPDVAQSSEKVFSSTFQTLQMVISMCVQGGRQPICGPAIGEVGTFFWVRWGESTSFLGPIFTSFLEPIFH